jgi:hypothetical protein
VNAALTLCIEANLVEDETTDDGEIDAGGFHASAHLVVVQRHIKTPMDTILYTWGRQVDSVTRRSNCMPSASQKAVTAA